MPQIQIGGHRSGMRTVQPVYAEVDDEDYERLSKYKWSINKSSSPHVKYAQTNTGGKKIHMHRLIMGLEDYADDKRIINHIDGNGLNNKKSNMEICDMLYNSQSFRRHHGEHNVGCVYYDTSMKRVKRWRTCITINKVKTQKRFETEDEANAYLQSIIDTL